MLDEKAQIVDVLEQFHDLESQHVLPAVVSDLEDSGLPVLFALDLHVHVESLRLHLLDAELSDLKLGQVGSLGS